MNTKFGESKTYVIKNEARVRNEHEYGKGRRAYRFKYIRKSVHNSKSIRKSDFRKIQLFKSIRKPDFKKSLLRITFQI